MVDGSQPRSGHIGLYSIEWTSRIWKRETLPQKHHARGGIRTNFQTTTDALNAVSHISRIRNDSRSALSKMADPETGLRCFILADYPDLAAYFDNTYSYCGDSSHEKYAVYDCSYPDKALIVDEKRQQASLAHIIGGWSYQPDCHMRGLGNKPREAILKAIKEQAEARAPTKKNDRPLNTPSVR